MGGGDQLDNNMFQFIERGSDKENGTAPYFGICLTAVSMMRGFSVVMSVLDLHNCNLENIGAQVLTLFKNLRDRIAIKAVITKRPTNTMDTIIMENTSSRFNNSHIDDVNDATIKNPTLPAQNMT